MNNRTLFEVIVACAIFLALSYVFIVYESNVTIDNSPAQVSE